jgi:hypothetical protein
VLDGSVAKLQGIDASTVEAVRVMGDSVGVMGTYVHSIEAAIQRLEALDWKSEESMHVMDQTLDTLRAAVIRLDKIDVKTLDSMQSMITTIENMKLSLIKLDKLDLLLAFMPRPRNSWLKIQSPLQRWYTGRPFLKCRSHHKIHRRQRTSQLSHRY